MMQLSPVVTGPGRSEHEIDWDAEKAMILYCLLDGQIITASLAGHLRVLPLAETRAVKSFLLSEFIQDLKTR